MRKLFLVIISLFIVFDISLLVISPFFTKNMLEENKKKEEASLVEKEDTPKKESLEEGTIVLGINPIYNGKGIFLENNNIRITNKGTYNINGYLPNGKIIVDTIEEVTLNLKDVTINNTMDSTIESRSNNLIINLNSNNSLTSESNDVIVGDNITFNGNGSLNITNLKNNGIKASNIIFNDGKITINSLINALDNNTNYTINNGNIIFFSNSNLATINNETKQNTIILELPIILTKDDTLTINSELDDEVITIKPSIDTKNILISIPTIVNGNYYFTKNKDTSKEKIIINNQDLFSVTNYLNEFK